jgi:hypothetical protein
MNIYQAHIQFTQLKIQNLISGLHYEVITNINCWCGTIRDNDMAGNTEKVSEAVMG